MPQPSLTQKQDADFVVQPRYWVEKAQVDAAIPRLPAQVATALTTGGDALRAIMALWAAGYCLNRGALTDAARLLRAAQGDGLGTMCGDDAVLEAAATELEHDYPLDARDEAEIEAALADPEPLARQLVERFSPKWLMGWREICRGTDERTMIASALPVAALGNKFPIMYSLLNPQLKLCFLANLNSFVLDYLARQKLGGTSMSFYTMRQLAVLHPSIFRSTNPIFGADGAFALLSERAFELTYSANDLGGLSQDCAVHQQPFCWDEDRRFALRCEMDAAFFHLYLPAAPDHRWLTANGETADEMKVLTRHFPTPRDAVAHIMDQFPTVKRRDERAFDCYRTKDRIIEFYNLMQEAQASRSIYTSPLEPSALPERQSAGVLT